MHATSKKLKELLASVKSEPNYNVSHLILPYKLETLKSDYICHFGHSKDGVSEMIVGGKGDAFEIGYYYGYVKPKPIVNISTMIGCPKKCQFCELGSRRFVRNLTPVEMVEQVILMIQAVSSRDGVDINTKHKVNLAKSGEPLLNPSFVEGMGLISNFGYSFKVSSVVPDSGPVDRNFKELICFAANYSQPVQLQFSLISTDINYRRRIAGGKVASLEKIQSMAELWAQKVPNPRKVNLSLILTEEVPVDVKHIKSIINPEHCVVRIRPYVKTDNGQKNNLNVAWDRTEDIVNSFTEEGYEVSTKGMPTQVEWKYALSSNSTLQRYYKQTLENAL